MDTQNKDKKLINVGIIQMQSWPLEIDKNLSGGTDHTLAKLFDATATSMGGRLLRRWLNRPIRNQQTLTQRYQAIDSLIKHHSHPDLHDVFKSIMVSCHIHKNAGGARN